MTRDLIRKLAHHVFFRTSESRSVQARKVFFSHLVPAIRQISPLLVNKKTSIRVRRQISAKLKALGRLAEFGSSAGPRGNSRGPVETGSDLARLVRDKTQFSCLGSQMTITLSNELENFIDMQLYFRVLSYMD